ncbi:hypothetical protein EOS_35685 [Caballeronia mineralivorans PML1(12)]|uniref:Uncharacterized protein n=2 Tax=Caballeronia mineralivorans TaxID=2010198 RepID=A0A0J1CLB1_9BURK|nr:hypothetical protein EOS_35685 [Caballeronia mineralivorans PML1(12)]
MKIEWLKTVDNLQPHDTQLSPHEVLKVSRADGFISAVMWIFADGLNCAADVLNFRSAGFRSAEITMDSVQAASNNWMERRQALDLPPLTALKELRTALADPPSSAQPSNERPPIGRRFGGRPNVQADAKRLIYESKFEALKRSCELHQTDTHLRKKASTAVKLRMEALLAIVNDLALTPFDPSASVLTAVDLAKVLSSETQEAHTRQNRLLEYLDNARPSHKQTFDVLRGVIETQISIVKRSLLQFDNAGRSSDELQHAREHIEKAFERLKACMNMQQQDTDVRHGKSDDFSSTVANLAEAYRKASQQPMVHKQLKWAVDETRWVIPKLQPDTVSHSNSFANRIWSAQSGIRAYEKLTMPSYQKTVIAAHHAIEICIAVIEHPGEFFDVNEVTNARTLLGTILAFLRNSALMSSSDMKQLDDRKEAAINGVSARVVAARD